MAAKRRTPLERATARNVPIDTTGMDPEMAETIGGEAKRKTAQKMMYSGGAKAGAAVGQAESLVDKIKNAFKPKKK